MQVKATNRFPYIDALRGLAIIIVVFGHVEYFGFFNFEGFSIIGNFFQAIQMPLFFFISGFVVYKSLPVTTINKLGTLLWRKTLQLILPAMLVGLIYTYAKSGGDFHSFITNASKKGYWFTISLFEMMAVYYLISYIMNKFQKDGLFPLLAVSFVCFLLKLPFKDHPLLEEIGNYTSLHYTFSHFQFFAIGLIARKYMNKFETLMNSQLIMTLAILLMFAFFWLQLETFRNGTLPGSLGKVLETMIEVAVAYPTVYIMYYLFHRYYKPNFLNGSLEYVGKRTLDIYLIHYFFLPRLPMVGEFFKSYPNLILECLVGFVLALLVVGASLIVSRLITLSDFCGKYVLGSTIRKS